MFYKIIFFLLKFLLLINICGCNSYNYIINHDKDQIFNIQKDIKHYRYKNEKISTNEYIQIYKFYAIKEMHLFNIPASIKLAQAIHESNNGNSYLAKNANNHFGIKCGSNWKGHFIKYNDDYHNESFRVYKNILESYKDHSFFLKKERYNMLFTYNKLDYKNWSYGLQKFGYATNPNYADNLIKIIEYYKLYSFDYIPKKRLNKDTIHIVQKGETLYSISLLYNITIEAIKYYNCINDDKLIVGKKLLIYTY